MQLTWTQSGQTDPHTVTVLFCVLFVCPSYIQNVTRSEQIKSCITQCSYASEVVRNSQNTMNTAWRCRIKLCIFSFWISHCILAVGALETWTWWPHSANFRLDALVDVFSGSDYYSRICSHGEREREGGGGGGRLNRTYRWQLPLAWTLLSAVQ